MDSVRIVLRQEVQLARRREFADVADGISGHFIFDSPANPDWPLAYIARAVRAGDGTDYLFDLTGGGAEPPSPYIQPVSMMLHRDLVRHLNARQVPADWVSAASLHLTVGLWKPGHVTEVRCQVRIVDDRAVVHTSTRRGQMTIARSLLTARLLEWFRRSSFKTRVFPV
jgi:hypothetical protein